MGEPKVGDSFGSYNTMAKKNGKYYRKHQESTEIEPFWGHKLTKTTQVWADPNNLARQVWGHITFDEKGAKYPQDAAVLTVLYETDTGSLFTLEHRGSKRTKDDNNEDDIRFEFIYGENTYAKDIDGNGIVGKDEIFKIEKY